MLPFLKIWKFTVPMYSLCIEIGVLLAVLFLLYDCKRKKVLWNDAVIIGVTGIGMGFLGAKLLYLATAYTPGQIAKIIVSANWDLIINGGFVFYGGLIFGILGAFLGAKIAKCTVWEYANILIKLVPLVHAFGRIGCFCAGCCYGKPASYGFGVVYTAPVSDAPVGVRLIPVQLYEAAFNLALFIVMAVIDKKKPTNKILLPVYLLSYSIERFVIEYFRYDEIRGDFLWFSTSQWISIGLFMCGIIILIFGLKRQRKSA